MRKRSADDKYRWFVGGTTFVAGNGGIGRVARMTARALADHGLLGSFNAFSDMEPVSIAGQFSTALRGNRAAFASRCHAGALTHDYFLYDHIGIARAHPRFPGFRRPYGVWIHGVEVWDRLRADRAYALCNADFILSNSQYTLDRFERLHGALENAQVCWLATEGDTPPCAMPDFAGPPTVLLIGRCDKKRFRKGHAEIIESWAGVTAAVPDAQLILVGGGNGLDLLRQKAARSPARSQIRVMGFVPEARMSSLWARAHVFAQPSWKEGFGLVYAEAMRHGLPVIASIHDAGREINEDGVTGFNVDLNRHEDLTARLVTLLRNTDLARKLGHMGHKRWRAHFRYSSFAKRFLDCIGRQVGAGKHNRDGVRTMDA